MSKSLQPRRVLHFRAWTLYLALEHARILKCGWCVNI